MFLTPLFILAPIGIFRLRHSLKTLTLILIPIVTISFSYALFHAEVRYRIPLDGLIILLAVLGLNSVVTYAIKKKHHA
ncbi:MAG: hypothetical protein U5R06_21100 [candidate division KSB1 bacterium]|nr:hypothetical protein [candidate division KSB1 bacterium]